jgi:hypothetical protein
VGVADSIVARQILNKMGMSQALLDQGIVAVS